MIQNVSKLAFSDGIDLLKRIHYFSLDYRKIFVVMSSRFSFKQAFFYLITVY